MRVQLNRYRRDEGAVAILVAVLTLVLVGLAAFTADFGLAYSRRQALSTGADSAALAVVQQEYKRVIKNPTATCGQLASADSAVASATALAQINANAPFGTTIPSSAVTTTLTCIGSNAGTLEATVSVSESVKTIFGGVFGVSSIQLNRVAAAALGATNNITGWLPITVCTTLAQAIVADGAKDAAAVPPVSRHVLVDLAKVWGSGNTCDGAATGAGNWAWLYCDSNGANALGQTITSGCPNPLVLDTSTTPPSFTLDGIPGDKGNAQTVSTPMAGLMDKIVTIPVYDKLIPKSQGGGNGANSQYRVIGVMEARLCAYSANKDVKGTCYLAGTDPISGLDVTLTKNSMQLQFVSYTPAADLSTVCALGTVTCGFNAYVTPLVR